uniref:Uncharacterized protein n=1 Tax=viral metagenome TaxID=1070528 RepID=A0A6M3JKB7_9ZZZZ
MEYSECDYYKGYPDGIGYCSLIKSNCLVEAVDDKCQELEEQDG